MTVANVLNITAPTATGVTSVSTLATNGDNSFNLIPWGDFGANAWGYGQAPAAISSASVGRAMMTADLFQFKTTSAAVITPSEDTAAILPVGNYPAGRVALKLTTTTADASVAAGDYAVLSTYIDKTMFAALRPDSSSAVFNPYVLSFWVRSAVTGTYSVCFTNGQATTNGAYYIGTYVINAANTWEYKSIAVPDSGAIGTWTYIDGGVSLRITWVLMAGSTYNAGTANTWTADTFVASIPTSWSTNAQPNAFATNANVFEIAYVQLEKGTIATPFKLLPAITVHTICRAYHETSAKARDAPDGSTNFWCPTCKTGATTQIGWQNFTVRKVTLPTTIVWDDDGTLGDLTWTSITGTKTDRTITIDASYSNGFRFYQTAAADQLAEGAWDASCINYI